MKWSSIAFVVWFGFVSSSIELAQAAARPNVIVVLSDDQGYGDFSCHGNPVLKTPNLDRLHDQGVRLDRFSRGADVHAHARAADDRAWTRCTTGPRASAPAARSSAAAFPPWPKSFVPAATAPGTFGKWHLGDSYPNLPQQRGFDETVYFMGWGITSIADLWDNDCFDGRFRHNGMLQRVSRLLHRRLVRPGQRLDSPAAKV